MENLDGWLTTVVARISLNALRTRRTRAEQPLQDDVRVPDPVVSAPGPLDPEQEALLADSVGLAMLVVLETLTPAERLAFVLHDVFAVPFEEIAAMVDRSPAAARQLASRARRRVQAAAPEPDVGLAAQREVVEASFAAGRSGDFDRLVAVLSDDVVLRVDQGSDAGHVVEGSGNVAGQALMFAGQDREVRAATINGAAGAVIVIGGRPVSVMGFTILAGRVAAIDILADQARLAALDLSAIGLEG